MSLKEQVLQNYTLEEERYSKDLNSILYRFKHKNTGARVAVISNDDANKVFYIGFRTPPTDSTGVLHILEHSVLCGSKNFPLKDPFMELVKGSLNTFLNAMTFPDRTLYPVASLNDQDFQNLMHIYLDSVFYPNIYKEANIFKQEGWHYELADLDAPLTVNGVVYNEMKGAFSNPDEVLEREIMNSLFPDTCYGVEAGGDPACIPDLTYEQFLDFHRTLYHPGNSYIYLYGNMDIWEKLSFIHEKYLKDFSSLDKAAAAWDTSITKQPAFDKPREVTVPYAVMEGEDTAGKAQFAYNVVVGSGLDAKLCVALDILDYALCSAPGAPLKQALIDAGIGKDVYSNYADGILQPYFSIIARDADLEQKEQFVEIIERRLKQVVEQGFDKKALQAAIHYSEFRYRESDFGRTPKGIVWGMQVTDGWNYAEDAPFLHLEEDDIYRFLKEQIDKGYFEALVEKYLLNNSHKSIVVLTPKPGLTEEREQVLAERLAAVKASMSKSQLEQIMADMEALEAYQDKEDSAEAIASIPLLTREDLNPNVQEYINEVTDMDGVTNVTHPLHTNGIAYVRLIFDTKDVPQELFPYLPLLKACMGYMDTDKHSYGDLFNEMNLVTGGIVPVTNIYTNAGDFSQGKVTFELKAKMLYEDMEQALPLMLEILLDTDYASAKRLQEIIAEGKSRLQGQIGNGHIIAAMRAMSYFSRLAAINETLNGVTFYRLLEDLDAHFADSFEETADKLNRLCRVLFRKENLMLDITAEAEGIRKWAALAPQVFDRLYTCKVETGRFEPVICKKNEGFLTSGQVQYVCMAGNFYNKGLCYHGAFQVLKAILGYEYLYTNIRVKGGAYGCMCAFGKTGDSYLVSYRDPHLNRTIDVFKGAAEAVAGFDADERTITQYVIGAVGELDTPMTPATLGMYSLGGYLTGRSIEDVRLEREQILNCTPADIRALAPHISAITEEEALCVVGSREKLARNAALFKETVQLF